MLAVYLGDSLCMIRKSKATNVTLILSWNFVLLLLAVRLYVHDRRAFRDLLSFFDT